MSQKRWEKFWKSEYTGRISPFRLLVKFFREKYFLWPFVSFAKKYCKKEKMVIVEAGCGSALSSFHLLKKNDIFIGLDYSSYALKIAEKKKPKNLRAKFILCDINKIPLKNNIADFVWNIGVLEHSTNPHNVLKEMKRITKPNGIVGVIAVYKFGLWNLLRILLGTLGVEWSWGDEYPVSKDEIQKIFEKLKMKILEMRIEPLTFSIYLFVAAQKI